MQADEVYAILKNKSSSKADELLPKEDIVGFFFTGNFINAPGGFSYEWFYSTDYDYQTGTFGDFVDIVETSPLKWYIGDKEIPKDRINTYLDWDDYSLRINIGSEYITDTSVPTTIRAEHIEKTYPTEDTLVDLQYVDENFLKDIQITNPSSGKPLFYDHKSYGKTILCSRSNGEYFILVGNLDSSNVGVSFIADYRGSGDPSYETYYEIEYVGEADIFEISKEMTTSNGAICMVRPRDAKPYLATQTGEKNLRIWLGRVGDVSPALHIKVEDVVYADATMLEEDVKILFDRVVNHRYDATVYFKMHGVGRIFKPKYRKYIRKAH